VERHSYDQLGRDDEVSVSINGKGFTVGQAYDKFGRVSQVDYPEGFVAVNNYDAKGFLKSVADGFGPDATIFWQVNSVDVFGHVTKDTLGNGVQDVYQFDGSTGRPSQIDAIGAGSKRITALRLKYDVAGNLLHRDELVQQKSETFGYDELSRLTSLSPASSKLKAERYIYDAGGRFTFKSGTGTYSYPPLPSTNDQESAIVTPVHGVKMTTVGGKSVNYSYDQHGNMVSDEKDIYHYNSDNRLTGIQFDPTHDKTDWVHFDYTASGVRYRELSRHGLRTLETLFVGGFQQITEFGMNDLASSNAVEHPRFIRNRWYISNSMGTIAVVEKNVERFDRLDTIFHQGAAHPGMFPSEQKKIWYLHRDQLGSILAITDEAGTLRARYWYDPWGKRSGGVIESQRKSLTSGQRLEDSTLLSRHRWTLKVSTDMAMHAITRCALLILVGTPGSVMRLVLSAISYQMPARPLLRVCRR
jgi:uncharacterized protein RhaS with RHS repeats